MGWNVVGLNKPGLAGGIQIGLCGPLSWPFDIKKDVPTRDMSWDPNVGVWSVTGGVNLALTPLEVSVPERVLALYSEPQNVHQGTPQEVRSIFANVDYHMNK
jgi:hypothetical protein